MDQPLPRTGHFAFKAQGPLSLALEMVDQEPIHALQGNSASLAGVDGKVDGAAHHLAAAGRGAEGRRRQGRGQGARHRGPAEAGRRPARRDRRQRRRRPDRHGGRGQGRDAHQWRARQGQLAARIRRHARQAAAAAHPGQPRQQRPHPARPRRSTTSCRARSASRCWCRTTRSNERSVQVRADLVNAESVPGKRRLAQAEGAAQHLPVRRDQGRRPAADRAAQRQAGRRQRRHRGLDGHRRRPQAEGVPLPAVLPQRDRLPRTRSASCGPTTCGR